MARVEVLIPTRNRIESLARCLRSVARQEYTDLRIRIADDASEPPVRGDELPSGRHAVDIIRLEKPGGVIGARLELLRKSRSPFVLFLDDDVELQSDQTVDRIISIFDNRPKAGIVTLVLEDRLGGSKKLLSPVRKVADSGERYSRVGWFYGGAFAIRRAVIEAEGLPTTAVYYGHEEIELSYLAAAAGYEIVCLNDTFAIHHRSERETEPRDVTRRRFRYAVRNRLALARSYLPNGYRQTHVLFWLLRYFWAAARSGSLGSFVRGARDGLFHPAGDTRRTLPDGAIRYLSRHGGRLWY